MPRCFTYGIWIIWIPTFTIFSWPSFVATVLCIIYIYIYIYIHIYICTFIYIYITIHGAYRFLVTAGACVRRAPNNRPSRTGRSSRSATQGTCGAGFFPGGGSSWRQQTESGRWTLFLVGGFNLSEKYENQLGWLFPTYGKFKNVPSHQLDFLWLKIFEKIGHLNTLSDRIWRWRDWKIFQVWR